MVPARRLAALVLAVAALLGACSDSQDPGLAPQERPDQTSVTLGPCPDGGPDATTPDAGCLMADGRVERP